MSFCRVFTHFPETPFARYTVIFPEWPECEISIKKKGDKWQVRQFINDVENKLLTRNFRTLIQALDAVIPEPDYAISDTVIWDAESKEIEARLKAYKQGKRYAE
jgi:hypothetical protein